MCQLVIVRIYYSGQVYEARLKTGEDVVIKVQKPGVAEVLKTDLGFMYVTSKLVEVRTDPLLPLSLFHFNSVYHCSTVASILW